MPFAVAVRFTNTQRFVRFLPGTLRKFREKFPGCINKSNSCHRYFVRFQLIFSFLAAPYSRDFFGFAILTKVKTL
jgi:hypothetical protein